MAACTEGGYGRGAASGCTGRRGVGGSTVLVLETGTEMMLRGKVEGVVGGWFGTPVDVLCCAVCIVVFAAISYSMSIRRVYE